MIIIGIVDNKKSERLREIGEDTHFLLIEKVNDLNCYRIFNPEDKREGLFTGNADNCLSWIKENDLQICLSNDYDTCHDAVNPSPELFLSFMNNTSLFFIENFSLINYFERNRLQNIEKGLRMIKENLL